MKRTLYTYFTDRNQIAQPDATRVLGPIVAMPIHKKDDNDSLYNMLPEVVVTAKYPHEQRVIDTMNASNAEFMKRLRNNDLRAIHNADGSYSTHVLGNADNMVFPAIQDVNGVLEDYRNLPWQRTLDRAIQNKDYIEFPTEGDARYFGEHYKKYFPEFFSHFGDNQYAEGGPKGRRGATPTRAPIGGNRFRLSDTDEESSMSSEEIAEYNRKLEEKNAEIARQDAERRARDLEEARRNGTLKHTSFDKTLEAIGEADRKMHQSAMKSHSFDRLRRAQDSLSQGVNTEIATAKGIANASQQYANEQMEKKQQQMHDIKKGFDATATALEMGAAGYTIGHLTVPRLIHTNTGWLGKVSDFFTNSNAQLGANAIGSLADGYQLLTADNKFDRYENGIELGGDTAGIVGGLDIVRNSNIFGRYSKPIDTALDTIGLSTATWDIAKNMPPFSYYYGKLKDYVNGTNDTEDNQYADGGEMDTPKHWNELSMADKSDAIASAVRNGVTTLEDIRKAWDDYADSGYREDSSYRDNSEDMGNTLDDYDDTYQEETHEYLKGGYKPSAAIKNRIANWEGSSMQTNRSFEAEAKDFWNAIPSNVRSKLSQQQADALYSYSYNVGAGNFKKRVVPSLERYFNGNGSVEDVQRHMYATKDKDYRGLAKRRAVERAMFGGQRVEDVSSFDYDYSSNSSPYGHRFTVNNNFQTAGYLGPIVNGNNVNGGNTNKTNVFLQALEDDPKQTIAESTPEPRYSTLERLQNIYSMYGMDDYANEIGKYNPFAGLTFAEGGKKSADNSLS